MTDKIGSTRTCVRTKCPRRKLNTYCGEGGGGFICMHGRRKSVCKECGGASICEHWREQCTYEECGGGSVCEHGRRKPQCSDCNGSHICRANGEAYNSGCRTLGNRRLDRFCTHCFANFFPDDPRTLNINKSKELQVVAHIASTYDGFVHDRPLYVDLQGGCCSTKRHIDICKLINNTMLRIEVD